MYDGGKVIAGIAVFLIVGTFPFWYNPVFGKPSYTPDPELPKTEKNCVMPAEFMRAWHMDLLNSWRDEVVREGERHFKSPNGAEFNKSLTNTCLKCHGDKSRFCDKCHEYVGVENYCWDCHIDPEAFK